MRTCLCLLPLTLGSFLLFACAPADTGERLSRLEAQMQAQQVADLRLAHMEDRMADVESAIGELRGSQPGGKEVRPRPVAKPAAAAQAPVPVSAAPQPVTAAPSAVAVPPATGPSVTNAPAAAPLAPAAPASSPLAGAMADLAAETGAPVQAAPAPSAQTGAYAPVPYPQDPLLSGGAPITQPLPGMTFNEQYQLMPGGRRVTPGATAAAGQGGAPAYAGPGQTQAVPAQSAPAPSQAVPGPAQVSPAPPQTAQSPAPVPSQPQAAASSDKAAYASALALYEKNQVAAAEKAFTGFLQQYPNSPLVPNAMYWLGECYYSTNRLDNAIMIFKDVAGRFPKHDKAAASLLKAGYAYAKMGDMENAYFYWQILLDDFPGSAPANLARKRMANR